MNNAASDKSKTLVKAKLKTFPLVVLLSALTVSAVFMGSGASVPLALAVIVFSGILLFGFIKSLTSVFIFAIPVFLTWLYSGNIVLSALVCSMVMAVGVSAFLIKTVGWKWLIFSAPLIYLIALLLCRNPIEALLSLSFLPAAVVLGISISGDTGRVTVICRVSVALALTGAVALAAYLLSLNGSLSFDSISASVDNMFDKMVGYYTSQYAQYAERYQSMGIDPLTQAVSPDDARHYTIAVFGLLPALTIIGINVISFVSYQITVSLFAGSGQDKYVTRKSLSFSMSWVSATVYLIAYLVMFIASYSNAPTVTLISENIYLMLLPGLVFTGVLVLLGKSEAGRRHTFWLTVVIILAFASPNLALSLAAFIGAAAIIRINLAKRFPPREAE